MFVRGWFRFFLFFVFVLMILRPPRYTRTDTLVPYTTLFRSLGSAFQEVAHQGAGGEEIPIVFAPSEVVDERSESERSEEHTSELQSLMRISYAVFCLKKKKRQN